MNLVKYDFTSPKLYANNGCYLIDGIATDSSATDTRLKQLDFPISDQNNVNIIANNTFPAPLARYSVSLINQYLDGSFKVRATDSAGLYSELNYDIPGFTIAMKDIKESTIVPEIIDTILYGKERCFDIIIENYGKFPHKINYLIVKSSVQSDTIPEYTGTVLQAGEQRTFRYCITPSDSGIFNFDITIEDSCTKREITKLSLYSLRDTDPPNVQASIDSCNINYYYDIYEELKSDGGISNANIIESSNINVEHTEI